LEKLRCDLRTFTRPSRVFKGTQVNKVFKNCVDQELATESKDKIRLEKLRRGSYFSLTAAQIEDESKIIDTLVRSSIKLMRKELETKKTYSDCLEEWLNQPHTDFHCGRGLKFFTTLSPCFVAFVLHTLAYRALKFVLWNFYTVLLFRILIGIQMAISLATY
jgi:hypothetical protein